MSDILKEQKGEGISFDLTENNRFFLQMLNEIETDQRNEISWEHENKGQNYKQIFQSSYDMKSPEEKAAIQAYLNREK